MSAESLILIGVFFVSAYAAWRLFAREHFSSNCGGSCNCSQGKNIERFLEAERKKREKNSMNE